MDYKKNITANNFDIEYDPYLEKLIWASKNDLVIVSKNELNNIRDGVSNLNNKQSKINEILKRRLYYTERQNLVYNKKQIILLAILVFFILVWMIGVPWKLYCQMQKNSCWVYERSITEEYSVAKMQSSTDRAQVQGEKPFSIEEKDNSTDEQSRLRRKTISEKTYGVLIVILLFAIIIYVIVLGILIYTFGAFVTYLKKKKYERKQEDTEFQIVKLLAIKKYWNKYGDKYIELKLNHITKSYLDE